MSEYVLVGIGGVLILATGLSLWRRQSWWVRICDFPRLQIAAGLLLVLCLHSTLVATTPWAQACRVLLVLSLALQLWCMFPYTRWARAQVRTSEAPDPKNGIRLLFANVLQTQHEVAGLLAQISELKPDLVLALETDLGWQQRLAPLLSGYPHTVLQPQDNTYGMLLYSRIPLTEPQVRFLIEEDVPSIHLRVRLGSGAEVHVHCLHPRPPSPTEADSSVERDAELLIVGRAIKENPCSVIVMGDLNDVAWSYTSALFRRISGLLDPRIGRGFFNTFNARHRWIRFPLDHFFHSNDFKLVEFKRLEAFGSDHFPVYIHLSHEPEAQAEQPEPHADADDRQEASDKIAEARESNPR